MTNERSRGRFLLQLVRGGGGRLLVCLRHGESLSLHDRGCSQTAGQRSASNTVGGGGGSCSCSSADSFSPPSGFLRVRFPSSRPALGDRPVSVHRAQVSGLLRRAEGRRYGLPVLDLCPTSPHHPPAVPAGPGRRPPGPAHPTRQRPRLPRVEGLQHSALQAKPQQPGCVHHM